MRLTDERIDEILRPKDIIGQTELESLASEVRELREQLAAVESCRDKYGERERKAVSTMFDERKSMLETIRRLTNEIADDRDLLRRFRALFQKSFAGQPFSFPCSMESEKVCRDYDARFGQPQQPEPKLTPEFLAGADIESQTPITIGAGNVAPPEPRKCNWDHPNGVSCPLCGNKSQPEPVGELVPWDAETAPYCPAVFRRLNGSASGYKITACSAEYWRESGVHVSSEGMCGWDYLFKSWEWSRDGKTWERCGVVR